MYKKAVRLLRKPQQKYSKKCKKGCMLLKARLAGFFVGAL